MTIKIAMIEPHGQGGICHYTHELSTALESVDVSVTLFTNDSYELEGFARNHAVQHYSSSALKAYIEGFFSKFRKRQSVIRAGTTNSSGAVAGGGAAASMSFRSRVRGMYLQCELLSRMALRGIRVIHIQWLWPSRSPVMFVRLAKVMGFKVIYTAHNILPHDDSTSESRHLLAGYYAAVDKIIVHSNDNCEELHRLFDIPENKVAVIPHGNYGFFAKKDEAAVGGSRQRLGIAEDKKVLLFFGSIQKYKGLDVLLQAFKVACQLRQDLYLIIAGKLTPYDHKDIKYFESTLIDMDIGHLVQFRPDYIPMDEVSDYFEAADVVVLPYLKTYQSGILQLAYAFGKPVIATNTGGMAEVVRHKESGLVVEPDCVDELANALSQIFDSADACLEMGRFALELSRSTFSWRSIADKTASLYLRK